MLSICASFMKAPRSSFERATPVNFRWLRAPWDGGARSRNPAAEADSSVLFSHDKASSLADRRAAAERRTRKERRSGERRQGLTLVAVERRARNDRRAKGERRAAQRRSRAERRAEESAAEHIRNALQLIAQVADSHELDDEHRRGLDAALFRLRFALDRLEPPRTKGAGGAGG